MVWVKRGLLVLATLLLAAILLTAIGYRKLHGIPTWYSVRAMTASELEAAAHSAENKLTNMQNWAAEHHAEESAKLHGKGETTAPAVATTKPAETTTIELSEDELNAFFQKWVASSGWAEKFGKYVTDPAIFLQDGRVILAGTVRDIGAVASVHFEPKITENGQLDLKLVRVLGGNLPLPKAVWSAQREKLTEAIARQLPQWQKKAAISPSGTANLDAVDAGLTETFLRVMDDQASEPVIFLPVAGHGAIPARLTAVSVEDKTLSLTVAPMTSGEREGFLERLKKVVVGRK